MSIRRKIGDLIYKKPGFGFTGESALAYIPNVPENIEELQKCYLCDDWLCVEWPTIYTAEQSSRALYHVTECAMEDIDRTADNNAAIGTIESFITDGDVQEQTDALEILRNAGVLDE